MNKKYNSERINLFQGDSLEVLKEFPDNSIDSIVTDPPYGLGKEPDPVEVMRDWVEKGYHEVKAKGGFMGKEWDSFIPQPIIWKECLRVLKPGGHLLAFSGTRTHDWMTMSLRFAGFEIRDMITELYSTSKVFRDLVPTLTKEQVKMFDAVFGRDNMLGWGVGSGFPKSHNIGKAVDKLQGNKRNKLPNPKAKQQTESKNGIYGDYEATTHITHGTSEWEGWGTALKPALEPITLARKPLSEKTIAKNVLKYGTGGLNVDGCRVEANGEKTGGNGYIGLQQSKGWNANNMPYKREQEQSTTQGRWPANIIHDGSEEVVELFPSARSNGNKTNDKSGHQNEYVGGDLVKRVASSCYSDTGSAARFFYCAKASKKDRDEGCESLNEKQYSHDGREVPIENAYHRNNSKARNHHPTVKPTDLLRYLCRPITPPNGIVLDPFMGSGSTGKACVKEGFRFTGIDLEEEYFEIAKTRILHEASKPQVQDLFTEVAKKKVKRGQV